MTTTLNPLARRVVACAGTLDHLLDEPTIDKATLERMYFFLCGLASAYETLVGRRFTFDYSSQVNLREIEQRLHARPVTQPPMKEGAP